MKIKYYRIKTKKRKIKMLYSIGYQKLQNTKQLITILQARGIGILVDVRSKPYSRIYAFNQRALQKDLENAEINYTWFGNVLGGFSDIRENAIQDLAKWQQDKTVCLMCMESDPDKCHRKYEIAERLKKYFVNTIHL